jgi:hypothetical protein
LPRKIAYFLSSNVTFYFFFLSFPLNE